MTGQEVTPEMLEIGRLGRAHGLRGELRVQLHWDGSDALFEVTHVVLDKDGKTIRAAVETARRSNKAILLKLEGIHDRTAAEAWTGAKLFVARRDLTPLGPDEYYLSDLVGARVTAPDGEVGVVESIGLHPTVDTLVIRTPDGAVLEQPIDDHWLEGVDPVEGRVRLRNRDGLI